MRKKLPARISKTFTISVPPELAEFVEKRVAESPCRNRTEYFTRLAERDRDHNTLAEIFNLDAA